MKDNKFLESNQQTRLWIQYINNSECSLFGPRFSYCCFLLLLSIKIDAAGYWFKATNAHSINQPLQQWIQTNRLYNSLPVELPISKSFDFPEDRTWLFSWSKNIKNRLFKCSSSQLSLLLFITCAIIIIITIIRIVLDKFDRIIKVIE